MKNTETKKNKDNKNKYIGIISIIVLTLLAVLMLNYFYAQRPPLVNGQDNTNLPIEGASALGNNNTSDQ